MPTTPDQSVQGDGGEYHLLPERLAVRVGAHEAVVSATQFRLLAVLMSEPGRTMSRAKLVEKAFGRPVELRTVDVHIKEIRRKLEPHGGRNETVRGTGYRYGGMPG
jgi:two-component system phosphate regulon response regulator PhoB